MMMVKFKIPCPFRVGSTTVILAGCLVSFGCSSLPKGEAALDMGIRDRGVASWYGKEFHGRLAANGEVFDMTALTAAHRRLPLGSLVRVVNLVNGKQVYVRINDRGPYVVGRILDLSYAAAEELGMVEKGTSVVHLEVIGEHRTVVPVVSSFSSVVAMPLRMEHRQDGGSTFSLSKAKDLLTCFDVPAPSERLFPYELLHERRERRIAAILAAEHTVHNNTLLLT